MHLFAEISLKFHALIIRYVDSHWIIGRIFLFLNTLIVLSVKIYFTSNNILSKNHSKTISLDPGSIRSWFRRVNI